MRRKNLDLILALLIVGANVAWLSLPIQFSVIRIILALPLIFVLPGYWLTEVFFQARRLENVQRLVFSLALSLAVTIISGFGLNLLPEGLNALSWTAALSLFSVVFLLIAYVRRLRGSAQVVGARSPRIRFSFSAALLFGLALVVAVFSVMYAARGEAQQHEPGFTQLWILPPVKPANSCVVRFGVHSFEAKVVTYHITMTMNKIQIGDWSAVTLAPQQQWELVMPIIAHKGANVIEVRLYRQDKPQVSYRKVDLTLHSSGDGTFPACTY